jgi:gamma-glutamyl:cysteine ligase YbdK (ATP-grasp superfamily)
MVGLQERVDDLEAQLAKAKAKRDSCRASLTFWSERLMLADETVTRSATPNALELASARAADELRRVHEDRDILERARRSVRQRPAGLFGRSQPTAVLTAYSAPAAGDADAWERERALRTAMGGVSYR